MPYETHWEAEGIRWVYTGTMTDDDVLRPNLELYEDPRFATIRYEIADFREVDEFTASAQTVRRLSRMDKDQSVRNPHVKVAIVVRSALTRGIAHMYGFSGGDTPWTTEVFESEEAARDWLAS